MGSRGGEWGEEKHSKNALQPGNYSVFKLVHSEALSLNLAKMEKGWI